MKLLLIYRPIAFIFYCLILCLACQHHVSKNNTKLTLSKQVTVLFFLNTECPICEKYLGSFKKINTMFGSQYDIKYIFPGYQNKQTILQYCQYDSILSKQIIQDTLLEYTKLAKATVTPQVVIINNQKIIYSGKIDDRFMSLGSEKTPSVNYVDNTLNLLQKNEEISYCKNDPIGCIIEQ